MLLILIVVIHSLHPPAPISLPLCLSYTLPPQSHSLQPQMKVKTNHSENKNRQLRRHSFARKASRLKIAGYLDKMAGELSCVGRSFLSCLVNTESTKKQWFAFVAPPSHRHIKHNSSKLITKFISIIQEVEKATLHLDQSSNQYRRVRQLSVNYIQVKAE